MTTPPVKKKDWILNKNAFDKLLLFLDADLEVAETKYQEIKQKLIRHLSFLGSPTPEELADKAMDIVARKLSEDNLELDSKYFSYFLTVAKNLLHDYWKSPQYKQQSLSDLLPSQKPSISDEDIEKEQNEKLLKERKLECLNTCLDYLPAADRKLLKKYYQIKNEMRETLASQYGLTIANLRVRIFRIKEKLKICINGCVRKYEM